MSFLKKIFNKKETKEQQTEEYLILYIELKNRTVIKIGTKLTSKNLKPTEAFPDFFKNYLNKEDIWVCDGNNVNNVTCIPYENINFFKVYTEVININNNMANN